MPAEAIQGIEGRLSATITVNNAEPTSGGTSEMQSVPSQAERNELKESLLSDLRSQAEAALLEEIESEDIVLPGGIEIASMDEERYEPASGQPASVLSLNMTATFTARYVRGEDLRGLAEVTLDGAVPPGYDPRPETLELHLDPAAKNGAELPTRFELQAARSVIRHIDKQQANVLVRGKFPAQASADLESGPPLAAPPVIKLAPPYFNALLENSEMFWIGHGDAPGSGGFAKDINELARKDNRDGSLKPSS